ncbi:MAG: carboxymuconolactone decarboxylase family protein [Melioribacteraceae bacterium]|nr:carboxymuconolactone decarboxylase family protein [Melioribacteraceae bacterium]MCF8353627.1 carboxymuconolactone decarboxylase family protein [Melioribacteraceae bacterium]MCF8393397.1 carboxymuconolactone decarboxylase family protein [Melioribacteraceae bacterium]MCF8419254.1 carboxymuconolactone decarboxylase family protein [Melioribacteraceae bacterium]
MSDLPKRFSRFIEEYPDVAEAYKQLGNAVHGLGHLDDKSRALIKLAISAGAGMEGAVHSHTRKAIEAGISKDEIRQTVLLALPTIGLPSTMAVMSWVDDILDMD